MSRNDESYYPNFHILRAMEKPEQDLAFGGKRSRVDVDLDARNGVLIEFINVIDADDTLATLNAFQLRGLYNGLAEMERKRGLREDWDILIGEVMDAVVQFRVLLCRAETLYRNPADWATLRLFLLQNAVLFLREHAHRITQFQLLVITSR